MVSEIFSTRDSLGLPAGQPMSRGFQISYFVLLLYVPSQQLWSWQDCQFT